MPKSKYPELFERIGAIIIHHEFTEEERGFLFIIECSSIWSLFSRESIHPAQFFQ